MHEADLLGAAWTLLMCAYLCMQSPKPCMQAEHLLLESLQHEPALLLLLCQWVHLMPHKGSRPGLPLQAEKQQWPCPDHGCTAADGSQLRRFVIWQGRQVCR